MGSQTRTGKDEAVMDIAALRIEAQQWVEANGPSGIFGAYPNRSCWNCNPAHEWMKDDMETPYDCIDCGHIYFKGQRLTDD